MKKVLVIEDNDEIRENTAELLAISNFEVLTAENGRTGFETAQRFQPDIILCDMMMPETDGRTFLKLAKGDALLRHTPIIFFSAGTPSIKEQNFLTKAANGFVKKPFLEEELLNTIQGVLNNTNNIFENVAV